MESALWSCNRSARNGLGQSKPTLHPCADGALTVLTTQVLDDGPIIEQDVTRISHRDHVEDLIGEGRDLDRIVLSRAVRRYILCYGSKKVIFD